VIGARENNLKNISASIPHRLLTVVTGVFGFGKSTLAFESSLPRAAPVHESMSPYARQFVEQLPRPTRPADRNPPTVAIEQRVTRGSRKSPSHHHRGRPVPAPALRPPRLQHHPEDGRG